MHLGLAIFRRTYEDEFVSFDVPNELTRYGGHVKS